MSNYKRYILTYPMEGQVIHKSDSTKRGVKKCYKEYKKLSGIADGLFAVTDIDSQVEYMFKIKNHKIYDINEQYGGYNGIKDQVEEIENVDNMFSDGKKDHAIDSIEKKIDKISNDLINHVHKKPLQERHEKLTKEAIEKKVVSEEDTIKKLLRTTDSQEYKYNKNICNDTLEKLDMFEEMSKYYGNGHSSKKDECILL